MHLYNERAFTFVETMISLIVISILLSISLPTIKLVKSPSYFNELAVFQFFTFIENETNSSSKITVSERQIIITDVDDREIEVSLYGDDVRRRVNEKGHELLIHDLKDITFSMQDHLLSIHVTTVNGGDYHKKIPVFQQ
ncbi:competence type IV pilus minor pilin ComGF [Halobacillus sp. B23F22_1]|uniref:competence type IV pilus minor pilin ComGF n=1 Tax=Halobacillus sp. B23F22_1 TaxID=3459514 RepID=UPI00373E2F20